jgi:GNAT superfamily N-acetyltransferase
MSTTYEKRVQPRQVPVGLTIRHFTGSDADYIAAVDITNQAFPEYPDTVSDWRFNDETTPAHIKRERWLAEVGGVPVAYGDYDQMHSMYHPHKFMVFLAVPPAYQGQGIGAALYDTVVAAVARHQPITLRSRIRADEARSLRFLLDRGYQEDVRDWESRLDVASFDPAPYVGHEQALRAEGIRIATMAELLGRDPDSVEKYWKLDKELSRDVPLPEPYTPMPYEEFARWLLNSPNFMPESHFVALDGPDFVGISTLWKSQADPSELYTGLTGVRRAYRRRGIALALKLRAISYARDHLVKVLKTWNASVNRPMLSINEALGFVKQPAWVAFVKKLREE